MKISIIGSGMVGTSIAYACMIKSIVREISLVDINMDQQREMHLISVMEIPMFRAW